MTSRGRGDTAGEVSVEVRNTGSRTGSDVVQVYVGPLPTSVDTPAKTLAGFARVSLAPGERTTATIEISRRTLSYWDEPKNRWVTPTGKVAVYVGSSAADVEYAGAITLT